MIEQAELMVDAIAEVALEKLRSHVEELLRKLELAPLTNEEWLAIVDVYPTRYWNFLSTLISEARRDHLPAGSEPGVLRGALREDLQELLKTLDLPSLTDKEWTDVSLAHCERHWRFINGLIGEVRGDQHFHDVEAAIERERLKDEKFSRLAWSITREVVQQFCDDNDESALSDEEMEELFLILHEEFDHYEVLVDAMRCLRTGTRRYPSRRSEGVLAADRVL